MNAVMRFMFFVLVFVSFDGFAYTEGQEEVNVNSDAYQKWVQEVIQNNDKIEYDAEKNQMTICADAPTGSLLFSAVFTSLYTLFTAYYAKNYFGSLFKGRKNNSVKVLDALGSGVMLSIILICDAILMYRTMVLLKNKCMNVPFIVVDAKGVSFQNCEYSDKLSWDEIWSVTKCEFTNPVGTLQQALFFNSPNGEPRVQVHSGILPIPVEDVCKILSHYKDQE